MYSSLLTVSMFFGLLPLARAIRANRRSSLSHALYWSLASWLAWVGVFAFGEAGDIGPNPGRYVALCLVGCAGVAVLGARRPHVGAWNFVVLGLLAVMVLPIAERILLGTHSMEGVRLYFLIGTLAVGIVNYVPTRLGLASLWMGIWCVGELFILQAPDSLPSRFDPRAIDAMLPITPWIAWGFLMTRDERATSVDRLWLEFRDNFGLVWSQRVREQFNHAAEHAGWSITLGWSGLIEPDNLPAQDDRARIEATLRATMQRFLPGD